MFHKIHFRLTMLFTAIAGLILIVMSLIYLKVTEQGLYDSSFLSFRSDMNTLLSYLEQQTVLSDQWLVRLEDSGKYLIYLEDNGTLLPYHNTYRGKKSGALYTQAAAVYQNQYQTAASAGSYLIRHTEFPFTSSGRADYYACYATIRKESKDLNVLVLYSIDGLQNRCSRQRTILFWIIAAALLLLFFFSRYFTRRLIQPMEESRQRQTRFVAAASHELRTPLAVITSAVSAFPDANADEKPGILHAIRTESFRMSGLVDDLLTLAGADSHSYHIHPGPTDLPTLLIDVYEAFAPMAKEKNIRLEADIPETLLPPVNCDPDRLRQVLSILVHNAVSYGKTGGHVRMSLQYAKNCVRIHVADDGPGIPDQEKERIFERFYRIEKARSGKGHYGLGLSIAMEIVRAHRGDLTVKDADGGGAVFTVTLPVRPIGSP